MMLKVVSSHKIQNNDESFSIPHSLTPAITFRLLFKYDTNERQTHTHAHTVILFVHCYQVKRLLCMLILLILYFVDNWLRMCCGHAVIQIK